MRERAEVLDDYAWELYNAHRFREAVGAGRQAVRLYAQLGDAVAVGLCLVRLSRHLFMAGETDQAEECVQRAVTILEPTGDEPALAGALLYRGAILALTDDPGRAAEILVRARDLAARSDRLDLAALALNYLGIARTELGDPGGLRLLRESIAASMDERRRVRRARLCNLAELLGRDGRLEELVSCVEEGLRFARERGFWSHAYNLEVHRCVVLALRGDLEGALTGLRALVEDVDDPGMLYAYSVPWLGRVLARRGDRAAGEMLAAAWDEARRQRLLLGLAYAGLALTEWAWLGTSPKSRAASRPNCFRAPSIRVALLSVPSCCATSRAPACPPSRSPAARSRGVPGCVATGVRQPRAGRRRETRTSRPSSSPDPVIRRPPSRACAYSTAWAPAPRRRAPACG